MERLARFCFVAYAGFFVLSGLGSMLIAHTELDWFFGLALEESQAGGSRNLLNQYRFLRAVEAGFGVLALLLRDRFFTDRALCRAFLATLLLIPVSRTVSVLVDGVPGDAFVGLMVVEYLVWAFLVVATRGTLRKAEEGKAPSRAAPREGVNPSPTGDVVVVPAPTPPPATPATPATPPTPPTPAAPPATPELLLVAYQCPQCGASVEIPGRGTTVNCSYCDAPIRIEGRPDETGKRRERPKREAGDAFEPSRDATINTVTFGRFEVAILRQAIHAERREAMRWLPIDERRAALFLLRVVEEEKGKRLPSREESVLASLAEAVAESLKERADPGLAAKAALKALKASNAKGSLEAFVMVFDAEKSKVETYNAGCKSGMILCSIEEGRQIDITRDRGLLKTLDLRGKQDAFANGRCVELSADDAVVVSSAALAGDGRGWRYGQRSLYQTLKTEWPDTTSADLAIAIKDGYWNDRAKGSCRAEAPVGDLLVVTVNVKSNVAMSGSASVDVPVRTFETESFTICLAPSSNGFTDLRALPDKKHVLTWLEGEGAKTGGPAFADAAFAVMNKVPGNHDRPQDGGPAGLEAAKLTNSDVRALVLYVDDRHNKLAFFAHNWPKGFQLMPRGERGGNLQQFGTGGHAWPKAGGRLVFPGALPLDKTILHLADLASAWSGGKASALYETCKDHEDHGPGEPFLKAFMTAAATDSPSASFDGVAAVTAKPGD